MPATSAIRLLRHWALLIFSLFQAGLAQAEISDGEIRVGLLLDMHSSYAHFTGQGSVIAAQMAIDDVGGKVAGRPIRLVFADHGNDVTRASQIARQWLYDEGVDVIGDVVGSPQAAAVQEINRKRGAVVFYNAVASDALTREACAATGVHWLFNGQAYATLMAKALTNEGQRRWFFITVDNEFGRNVEAVLASVIRARGGKVLGSVRHPRGAASLFPQLRQAVASGAEVIALLNAGQDMVRAVRESFDLLAVSRGKTTLAVIIGTLGDVQLITPQLAQGMRLAQSFYWNQDVAARRWSQRFFERAGVMPSDAQAGVYSSLTHYFKAVAASNSDEGIKVVKMMRELPISDPIMRNARLREDGRMVHDLYLTHVRTPEEIKDPLDILVIDRVVPGDEVFRPVADGRCPLLRP
ncbi:ABC transporter substrate-binding protein [Rhodocyclus tenuis]|uniref:ABC transporter substrate-binding protein n=1 Tax=Rhodocyclus gracilis TaxID=2929842 RepID=UPI001298B76F|nr:ABC transporter substrate-binding protein [Rhodocyclus gracilis]MRD72875.1 ABC transporter substrate-binding protein [Rhodocyclus gracilis]